MKGIFIFLLLTLSFQLLQAQNNTKHKTKVKRVKIKKSDGLTFPLGKPEDSLFVTFSKGSEESQLTTEDPAFIWVGKNSIDYLLSEVVITFSKPVTYVELKLSHFNNDNSGAEKVKDFNIITEQQIDITSSSKFTWVTGPNSGLEYSITDATKLNNNENHTITAAQGYFGVDASGQLTISNPQPFTQITFSHKVIWGHPNGILISTSIQHKLGPKSELVTTNQKDSMQLELIPLVHKDTLSTNKLNQQSDSTQESETIPQDKVLVDNSTKKQVILTSANKSNVKSSPETNSLTEPQPNKKKIIKSLKSIEHTDGYTFRICKQEDSMSVTYFKGDEGTQMSMRNNRIIWLGEYNARGDYSTIIIAFSKPVTDVTIAISEFNNNKYGSEHIQNFNIIDESYSDVSSSTSLKWTSDNTVTTLFNEKNQSIGAAEGSDGSAASGKLSVTNTKPFSYITFTHKSNHGTPNGVYIQLSCKCPEVNKEKMAQQHSVVSSDKVSAIDVSPQTIIDTLKEIQSLQKDSIVLADSIKPKEIEKASIASVVPVPKKEVVKSTPKKPVAPADKAPIKKVSPVAKAPVKKAPEKPVTKVPEKKAPVKPVVKSIPKKAEPVKQTVKKSSATQRPVVTNKVIKKDINKSKEQSSIKKTKPVVKQPYTLAQIAKLNTGDKIKLERVFFKQSLAELLPESYSQLDTLVIILNQYPSLEIQLQGYTDNLGDQRKNLILSEQRVVTVKKYLIGKGIAPERLTQRGFGGSYTVTDDTSEEGRKLNRRVEFMITKK